MEKDSGRLPSAPGYPAEPEPVPVSALRAGIPSAEAAAIAAWLRSGPVTRELFGEQFYPEWNELIAHMGNGWALDFATAIERGDYLRFAQGIEAAAADETAKQAQPVGREPGQPQADAPNSSPENTP